MIHKSGRTHIIGYYSWVVSLTRPCVKNGVADNCKSANLKKQSEHVKICGESITPCTIFYTDLCSIHKYNAGSYQMQSLHQGCSSEVCQFVAFYKGGCQ